MIAAYHALVHAGLWRYALGWTVGFVMSRLFGGWAFGRLRAAWREHMECQRTIADRLDPSTPGGIADLRSSQTSETEPG